MQGRRWWVVDGRLTEGGDLKTWLEAAERVGSSTDELREAFYTWTRRRAEAILDRCWPLVETIADALDESEELSASELRHVYRTAMGLPE